MVAGMPVVLEYINTDSKDKNVVQLSSATVYGGAPADVKRTDFVFLEVFRAQVETSPRAINYVDVVTNADIAPGDTISIGVGVLIATNAAPVLDEFLIGANEAGTAANIAAAINLSSNSFTGICTAQVDVAIPERVNLRAADAFAGAAGNAIPLALALVVPGSVTRFAPLFGGGSDTSNKPSQTQIYRHGNTQSSVAVSLVDDIEDPVVGVESTKRVQIQYRIRATGQAEGVNFKTQNGFDNGNVEAQGTQSIPVSQYRFVPADNTTVEGYIKVTGVGVIAAGDTITIDGTDLAAVNGAPVGPQFDVSSGVPATIVTSIIAAITGSVATANGTAFGDYAQVVPATAGNNLTITTSLTTSTSVNTSVNSAVSYDTVDNGLFVSGDGTEQAATALGTVDGFVYAIPVAFVFRRNDASGTGGFDPVTNTNGGLAHDHVGFVNTHGIGTIAAATSDRPDRNFHDAVVIGDILDLRRQVSPGGIDLKAELESQMTALLDGNFRTWAVDTQGLNTLGSGSGDVSSVRLVCNEVGDDPATGRGEKIGQWDHVRRRFGDQSVVEKRIFPILPTASSAPHPAGNPGLYVDTPAAGWQIGQVINIDLTALDATGEGNWVPTSAPAYVTNQWPAGTKVTNVLRVIHDDGNYATPIDQNVEVDTIQGVGTPHIEIALSSNTQQANGGVDGAADYSLVPIVGGSPRRIFVELEISYPLGVGLTATPDETLSPDPTVTNYKGAALENDTSKRPTDWEDLIPPRFRSGYREVGLEYVANDSGGGSGTPITDSVIATGTDLILPRRLFGSKTTVITVTETGSGPTPRAVNTNDTTWGSSERKIVLQGTGVGAGVQSVCNVEYFAQDPIPNFSSPGPKYQISVYYRTNSPQTVGVQAAYPSGPMPNTLVLKPLVMSRGLWTGITSSGSLDLAYPYSNPSDQIAVNANLESGVSPDFPGEWVLSSLSKISVGDFSADTGMLNLHQMVPVDPNSTLTFTDRDWDSEYRGHYKVSDINSYRPTAMAQPLSGVATHKVWLPFLSQATEDNTFFRKGEVLLVVISRYAVLDGDNTILFTDTDNESCAAVYRTRGLLLLASEQ